MALVMALAWLFSLLISFVTFTTAYRYDSNYVQYNLNTNKDAIDPLQYSGEWSGHEFTASPENWRFPFYTLFLDRFVNGDPTNDNINGTYFEHDLTSNQIRHGGDLDGLIDTLDYLQGMGIKGLYIAGSPFINQPWGYDSYSPLDLTILDHHFGTIEKWREAIDAIHERGMYVVLDNTFATLGDLIGFDGYLNESTPFTTKEHEVQWKSDRHYWDFDFGNSYNNTCKYPKFWLETGYPVGSDVTDQLDGCYDSDFDQYGDTEAFGVFPDWRRELTKFASVQDRLREWHEPVRQKLENFYCIMIGQLDIDGYRYDKATQSTIDAMGFMNDAMRRCARKHGKENFFLPGEITGGNVFGSLFLGRGRQPDMVPENLTDAVSLTNSSDDKYFLRTSEHSALDAAAFHYTTYRTLTRFLGMDGNLEAGYDSPRNWVDQWNDMLLTNDLVNANTGKFDPRHMFGVTNQDVFRWGAISQGVERQLLGHFITTLTMPGIPLLLWGEEQAFYILDNTAPNYIFGRQPISASNAWMMHGCYSFENPSTQYYQMPIDKAARGCHDETQIRDHRDPTAPVRNILRHMYWLRDNYPVLTDGMFLQQLSNQTEQVELPGSSGVPTEFGMWSILRSQFSGVLPDLSSEGGQGDVPIWLVFSNKNDTTSYKFDCSSNLTERNSTALIAPFDAGSTVKNLFYPFNELTLMNSTQKLGINGSTENNGCLSGLEMEPYAFHAYVPVDKWIRPRPMMTKFSPGHDARIESSVGPNESEKVEIEIQFSEEMSCESVTNSVSFNSTTLAGGSPHIDTNSVKCEVMTPEKIVDFVGAIPSTWSWKASLTNVEHGVHALTIRNPTTQDGTATTNATERLLFRIGQINNPVVFPQSANYSSTLLTRENGNLTLHHSATGANKWRYSTNWGSTFSDWLPYTGDNSIIESQDWSGTKLQQWSGEHVRVEYFSRLTGSSDIVQQGDLDNSQEARRFPHLFWNGPYNQYGYDAGLDNSMTQTDNNTWEHHFMSEWQTSGVVAQINVWGINPDGKPDQSFVYGDIDQDGVLDRLPPSSLSSVVLNITRSPPKPFLGWNIVLNDGTMKFDLLPSGSMWPQLILYVLLWVVPVAMAAVAVWLYMQSFYKVKFNEIGLAEKASFIPMSIKNWLHMNVDSDTNQQDLEKSHFLAKFKKQSNTFRQSATNLADAKRRMVLIATMEYDIEDWEIKIKIGGLGVMAQLMGKNLAHQDLIWVVPCVGGVEYPTDQAAEPMFVQIMDNTYEIKVQYHKLRNITYVLLDAPVFRQQTKSEPYPARMDDMTSAIYYSAWNQCIAQAINRFPIDLYHINDYHGSVAPLYLLPRTIPACLSLHNAEFQGLWPMRTKKESEEVRRVFNLPANIVQRYVQFGEVFNLLHAGASYLREHQDGFGAVGVSKKYGKRAYARYPIFWGLKKVGQLPNPDPSDVGEWDKKIPKDFEVDTEFEAARGALRVQAQEWAGLSQDPSADLFVFVGRWSMQKGVDLIADVFPSVLEANPKAQLIAVGPVIDLYGKFAAAKLDKMMQVYPGRVCSKPVFTALPPFIFSGAEFALIPSRDEPFGLVAVEFGRKGALGVGARVGGLGQMPGWWYTVESSTTSHLTHQFRIAIQEALSSKTETRAIMRARSAKQRFPVAQWVEDLEILQSSSVRIHDKHEAESRHLAASQHFGLGDYSTGGMTPVGAQTPRMAKSHSSIGLAALNDKLSKLVTQAEGKKAKRGGNARSGLKRRASLGSRHGPGHVPAAGDRPPTAPQLAPLEDVEEHEEHEPEIATAPSHTDSDSDSDVTAVDEDEVTGDTQLQTRRHLRQLARLSERSYGGFSLSAASTPGGSRYPSIAEGMSYPDASYPNSGTSTPALQENQRATDVETGLLLPTPAFLSRDSLRPGMRSPTPSMLSVDTVVGDRTDFKLQKVDPFFTDSSGAFYHDFETRLEGLNGSNSDKSCIEEFLVKSEKKWFETFRDAKLGRHAGDRSSRTSIEMHDMSRRDTPRHSISGSDPDSEHDTSYKRLNVNEEFLLGDDYVPPSGLKNWMQLRIGDWPVYSFFLALGQIIAANSYQITLLTGEVGQTAEKLYVIASIYLATSLLWWLLYRRFASVLCLSLPFFFYGLAFVFIGLAHFSPSTNGTGWIQNLGTAWYTVASSSGSIFFALNFGDEGGARTKAWVFRACMIQGTQQIYVVALWAWGAYLSRRNTQGLLSSNPVSESWKITAICLPIAVLLWSIGLVIWFGLPNYYRQRPGKMTAFYTSISRRKIVLWFFVTVLIQNFFLSAPYGRNWSFLWSSNVAQAWQIVLLVVFFFIGVWSGFLWFFAQLSKSHSWILPLFAIGLGAPRFAQIWWGTSNIGLYLPWAGGPLASALASRSLWLWLGTLDAIQGVGIGMILLATLTRVHVAFTLIMAQVLGSIATIVARACAPNKIGPGPISPDISKGVSEIWQAWFWIGLFFNLLCCAGFFLFYRKGQLSKP